MPRWPIDRVPRNIKGIGIHDIGELAARVHRHGLRVLPRSEGRTGDGRERPRGRVNRVPRNGIVAFIRHVGELSAQRGRNVLGPENENE